MATSARLMTRPRSGLAVFACLLFAFSDPATAVEGRGAAVNSAGLEASREVDERGLSALRSTRMRTPSGFLYPYPLLPPSYREWGSFEVRGYLDLGFLGDAGDDDEAQFRKYSDWGEGFLLRDFSLDLRQKEGLGYLSVSGGAVGRDDQFYRAEMGQIGHFRVKSWADHHDEKGIHGEMLSQTDFASRDVLVFRLENGARIIIRPSGTEPKNKVYVEVPRAPLGREASQQDLEREKRAARAIAHEISDAFTTQMLSIIGVQLPAYALRISGLVSLDRKISFVEKFMPEFERHSSDVISGRTDRTAVNVWIDDQLVSDGKDARDLVGDAVRAYLATAREQNTRGADQLDEMERIFFVTNTST